MMRRILVLFSVLALAGPGAAVSGAESLPAAADPVLLSVSGAVSRTNASGGVGPRAEFDRSMLAGLGMQTVRTSTDWTDGVKAFRGPYVRDVLDAAGYRGETVTATALNDYSVEIPVADFERYPVVLAMEMDGEPLTRRDKGPLWIVYPRDEFAELSTAETNAKWIWQLRSLEVR